MKIDQNDQSLPAIKLDDVTKIYDLYNSPGEMLFYTLGLQKIVRPKREVPRFTALRNISFSIGRGERVGLIGRNGAGKTTTLRLISGNYPPTSGQVSVQGSVQALMQLGLGFHPEFTGYENIKAALNYNGLLGPQLDEAIADVVDFCELGAFLNQPLKTYSLGMQSRVQFAAATAIHPDILIVDEVLGAGDAYFSAKSALRMERLAKSGCTLILVSHSWQMIQQYCERAIWLEAGRVRMDGPAFEVLAGYESHIAGATAKFHSKGDEMPVSHTAPWEMTQSQFSNVSQDGPADGVNPDSPEPEAIDGTAPDYAAVDWIADQLRTKENIKGDQETALKLSNGQTVFRVAGVNGLRFCDFRVLVDSAQKNVVRTGGAMAIEMDLVAQQSDHFACSYWIHFFGLDGMRLARVRSPIDKFELNEGEKRKVSVRLDPVLLGTRDYLLSFSVFDNKATESSADTLHQRFDMLPRCYQLKVLGSNDSDAPILHHNGGWHFGGSEHIVPAVIKDYI